MITYEVGGGEYGVGEAGSNEQGTSAGQSRREDNTQ